MQRPIIDINDFATNNPWLRKLRTETFGIILPDGWLGRPYDNQHSIKDIQVTNNLITITFDDIREIKILDPKLFEIQKIEPSYSSLKLIDCQEVILLWVPYGEELSGQKTTKRFHSRKDNTIELIGYFPVQP